MKSGEELRGRAILITGAGRGLGRAYALDAARHGAFVLVNDIDDSAQEVATAIAAAGGTAHADIRSVGTAAAAEETVAACVSAFGAIDGVITNAGICTQAGAVATPSDRAEEIIRVNMLGVLHTGTAALSRMTAAGRGAIVNIVSGSMLGLAGFSVYGASKGGVLSLTYCWAREVEGTGIHVHGLSPVALTAMMHGSSNDHHVDALPEDVAPLATFLLSDRAAHLNGQVFRLDRHTLSALVPPRFSPVQDECRRWDFHAIEQVLGEGRSTACL